MLSAFSILSVSIYLAAWFFQIHSILRHEKYSPKRVHAVIAVGILAHTAATHMSIISSEGFQIGIFKISSLFFLSINVVVWFSCLKKPLHNLFLLLLPLSVLAIISAWLLGSPVTKGEDFTPGIIAHILLSILAYSLLAIASVQALLLAYQTQKLKSKHPAGIMGLMPPLQTMETLMFELVWSGMAFLTLSIITGAIYIENIFAQNLSHKTVFSMLSWIIYAILLWGRHALGWRGTVAIRWTIGGFIALMLAYFGSKLVYELIFTGN